ncbi:MAG TPA: hypothetical protein VEU30_02335 [Thermoanaerobaculia bacterium]|nr:hypothetical protein [Thermoanaerobaculia bacterium]
MKARLNYGKVSGVYDAMDLACRGVVQASWPACSSSTTRKAGREACTTPMHWKDLRALGYKATVNVEAAS